MPPQAVAAAAVLPLIQEVMPPIQEVITAPFVVAVPPAARPQSIVANKAFTDALFDNDYDSYGNVPLPTNLPVFEEEYFKLLLPVVDTDKIRIKINLSMPRML